MRDEPDLPQRKSRRATSSNVHKIFTSLTNNKQSIKHGSKVSENQNERTTSGNKKERETHSYLPRQGK